MGRAQRTQGGARGPLVRCSRCPRRYRGSGEWNAIFDRGTFLGYVCPSCQTPLENAEAEVHAATLDYGANALGIPVVWAKGGAA